MAVLGLRFCVRAFSSCGKRGPLFIVVRGPLTIAASLVAEHRLQTRRLSSCGSRAQLLRGMWDLPRPGLIPVSPALAGRFSTTSPPGKPEYKIFKIIAIVACVKWYLIVVIVCISLMINYIKHLLMCMLAICISLWRNVYSGFCPLKILGGLLLNCRSSLHILDINLLFNI